MKTIKKFEIRHRRIRVAEPDSPYGTAANNPDTVAGVASRLLAGEEQEVFLVFLLDVKNWILGFVEAGRGAVDTCPVDPRVVFRAAVMQGASRIIVAHNHPTGDPTPSTQDLVLTERLSAAGKLLNVPVLDHVIIGDGEHLSFAERELL